MKTHANKRHKGLGKGLSDLMNDADTFVNEAIETNAISELPIDFLSAGIGQPRKNFSEKSLENLASSIAEHGVLQPLLVRELAPQRYEIIAGERRFRAARYAGLIKIPVAIMQLTDKQACEIALVENIQREDLSAIEEAEGYRRMMTEFEYTQEMLSTSLGKSRSHIANTLRLLTLPEEVKSMVDDGHLSAGHARTLVGLNNAYEMALEINNRAMSVREAENFLSQQKSKPNTDTKIKSEPKISNRRSEESIAEHTIKHALGTNKVKVSLQNSGSGTITLFFTTIDEMDALLRKISEK